MATRNASATWKGNLKEGDGTMALGSGVWEGPFSFKSRFEEGQGTNPEELIGAALAGCFTMQVSHMLSEAGHVPDSVETQAKVQIRNVDGNPTISQIDLVTTARVPGHRRRHLPGDREDGQGRLHHLARARGRERHHARRDARELISHSTRPTASRPPA